MARKLAVVVLNYNDPLSTIRYVNEIKNYKHIDQIIIVDNCSTDGSFETLKELKEKKIEVIKTNENKGYAYGNNFAIHYLNENIGEFKYIAISNPDVEVSEDAYDQCLNYLDRNQDVAIAAPRMYDVNDNPHQLSGWKIRSLKGDIMDSSLLLTEVFQRPHIERYSSEYLNQDVAFVDCVAGSFFIIRHSAFKEIGYFDEHTFLYFEEDILGSKLKKRNYKNVVLNTCRFKHYESITIDKNMNFMRKYRNLQKSKRYFHKTYNDRASRLKLLVLDFFTAFRTVEQNSVPVARKLRLDRAFRKFRVKAVAAKRLGLKGTLFKVGSKMKNGVNKSGSKIKRFIKKQFGKLNRLAKKINRKIFNSTTLIRVLKVIIVFINIILLPFIYLFRLFHVKKRVLYFSVVTWKWIKQRPHFVPLELVKSGKYKVDYRYQTLYKKHMPNETNKYVDNKIEKTPGFKVKPFPIFPANGKYIIINSIWNVVRSSFWYYDKIILTHPNQIDLFLLFLVKLKGTKLYYECMDNYEGWEMNKKAYADQERRLIRYAKHVIVSSSKLKEKMMSRYDVSSNFCTVVRNGYDKTLFENFRKDKTKLKHPNIVYIGTIDDWFDFESITHFAKLRPHVNVEIIGPIGDSVKETIKGVTDKNIIFHGPIEHDMVPQYIEDSDVLIMPFKVNDIIEYVDPVKLYEYLYLKKPVVTTYWSELDQFKNMVYFYDGKEDFIMKVDKALKKGFINSKDFIDVIKKATWEQRIKTYLKCLK